MASSKATASPSNTIIFDRFHFVRARINYPQESLTQHVKDVRWLQSWNAATVFFFFSFLRTDFMFDLLEIVYILVINLNFQYIDYTSFHKNLLFKVFNRCPGH